MLAADGATEARGLCKSYSEPIHLLLTDMVMAHQNGLELAELLKSRRPEMKTLYMSGYAEDVILVRGLLEESLPFIQKPFPPADLVAKVRQMMDSPRR